MKIDCLINCYNYRQFVVEAVRSALDQTRAFDTIIVVDDGSTDGSAEAIERQFGDNSRVRLIRQENQGQLSCFNAGFHASKADLLCFLDADDLYRADYLEKVVRVYDDHPRVDFVYTQHELFGNVNGGVGPPQADLDHGYSALLVYYLGHWIGAPTSCLSLRRGLAERILPFPFVDQWKIRADDCLVLGSSIVGGRKYRLASPLVRYRVHDHNRFYGRPSTLDYSRTMAINQLFGFLTQRLGLNMPRLAEYTADEFASHPLPWRYSHFRRYLRIAAKAGLPSKRRWRIAKSLWRLFSRQPKSPTLSQAATAEKRRIAA